MDRPTKEQVDYALEAVQFDCRSYRNNARVLAAEVRALRHDLELFRNASEAAELQIVELRATIARASEIGEEAQGVVEDEYAAVMLDVLRGMP